MIETSENIVCSKWPLILIRQLSDGGQEMLDDELATRGLSQLMSHSLASVGEMSDRSAVTSYNTNIGYNGPITSRPLSDVHCTEICAIRSVALRRKSICCSYGDKKTRCGAATVEEEDRHVLIVVPGATPVRTTRPASRIPGPVSGRAGSRQASPKAGISPNAKSGRKKVAFEDSSREPSRCDVIEIVDDTVSRIGECSAPAVPCRIPSMPYRSRTCSGLRRDKQGNGKHLKKQSSGDGPQRTKNNGTRITDECFSSARLPGSCRSTQLLVQGRLLSDALPRIKQERVANLDYCRNLDLFNTESPAYRLSLPPTTDIRKADPSDGTTKGKRLMALDTKHRSATGYTSSEMERSIVHRHSICSSNASLASRQMAPANKLQEVELRNGPSSGRYPETSSLDPAMHVSLSKLTTRSVDRPVTAAPVPRAETTRRTRNKDRKRDTKQRLPVVNSQGSSSYDIINLSYSMPVNAIHKNTMFKADDYVSFQHAKFRLGSTRNCTKFPPKHEYDLQADNKYLNVKVGPVSNAAQGVAKA